MGNLMTSMWSGVAGLKVNQMAINTTAHNLANIDTKGYVRQQVLLRDEPYTTISENHISKMQIGLGTNIDAIRQVRDVFLDKNYRLEFGRQNFYQVQADAAEEIEVIFGEFADDTFAVSLDDIWSALNGIAEEPDSIVKRSQLASTASTFVSYAELLREQLQEYQEKINGKIQGQVDRINEIGDQIKELNTEIIYQEANGQNANDYRDTRNLLLDELAGYVNIEYAEDIDGRVTVTLEGTQFVTLDRVFHLKTVEITAEEKQQTADAIDDLSAKLADKIKNATGTKDEILKEIKASPEWKALSKYGELGIRYNSATDYTVTFNNLELIEATANGTEILNYEPTPTGFHDVVWAETGFDVFRMTGEYASYNNTDVGSLKSILVARGGYKADYTDIPQEPIMPVEADYCDADGNFKVPNGKANYDKDMEDYNKALAEYPAKVEKYEKDMEACLLMNAQAQLDLLVHEIVTTINDIFSPNILLTKDAVEEQLELKGTNPVDLSTAVISVNGTTYTLAEAENAGLRILDIKNASIGMDDAETIGEPLFKRKNIEHYTEAPLLAADGTPITDKDGNEIKLKVYNEEYETDVHTMFTIGQIEVNQDMIDDVSKMPLNYNKYSELYGGYNYDICQNILDAWSTETLQISPNVFTPYNFTDYYDAIVGNVATIGGLYSTKQDILEETILAVGTARESILGVASEEELTNLITYQHAYNASSRYINVISELLETLINIGRQ